MIVAVHALMGATLGRLCHTHSQAALLGSVSHAVADMLPHRDLDLPKEALLLAGALTAVYATKGPRSREFAGALGAVLPDLENLVGRVAGIPDDRLLLPTHGRLHGPKTRSLAPQIAMAIIGLAALFAPDGGREGAVGRGTSSR